MVFQMSVSKKFSPSDLLVELIISGYLYNHRVLYNILNCSLISFSMCPKYSPAHLSSNLRSYFDRHEVPINKERKYLFRVFPSLFFFDELLFGFRIVVQLKNSGYGISFSICTKSSASFDTIFDLCECQVCVIKCIYRCCS
jgi:hypothetical protein